MIVSGMRLGDGAEFGADVAFLGIGADRFRQQFGAGFQFRRDLIEHGLHHRRNPGHGDDIADPEAGRARDLVRDKRSRRAGCAPCACAPR